MSKLRNAEWAFTFDDFTLVPQHSEVKSRKEPDISFKNDIYEQAIPIIASPMNTITEEAMVGATLQVGAQAVLHRYMSIDDQVKKSIYIKDFYDSGFWVAVGASGDYFDRAAELYHEAGVKRFCVDVANGHSRSCIDAVHKLKNTLPGILVMAGNVCSFEGTSKLAEVGTDLVRVGVGGSRVCSTRVVSGHGVPQLSVLEECAQAKYTYPNLVIISDGGARSSGDMVKALAIGADLIMTGSLLAGTQETPGEVFEENGKKSKYYNGMASEQGRSGWFKAAESTWVPEGVSIKVPYIGQSAKSVIEGLAGGIKVGLSYSGAKTVKELQQKAVWKRITSFGHIEGTPYGKKD